MTAIAACGDPSPTFYFAFDQPLDGETFWDAPFPSDLRLAPSGAPDLAGFPNPREIPILADLLSVGADRRGWPTMATAYFRATAPLPNHQLADVIAPNADAPAMLVDVDPESPERGTMFPIVARTLVEDSYTASNVVAVAPRPGIVLRASTRYAYVLRAAFAPGFTAPAALGALAGGGGEARARDLYAPLWDTLEAAGIARGDVIAATVFTTGDEPARLAARSEAVRAAHPVALTDIRRIATGDGFCHLAATVEMPQFQRGTQPFHSDGRFVLDGETPMLQGTMAIPIAITIPQQAMPANGWPLFQFFHGSGGVSTGVVDLGRSPTSADVPEPGKGPGFVVARHGIAAVSAAMPVNPERLPGADDQAYLNLNNLSAFPYTFQQGVIEQRLLLDAMLATTIPQSVVAGCGVPAPPGGVHRFDPTKLVAGGQSMGGMYTNLVGAVEPRFGALVPTGAGGFWNLMILETATVPGARGILAVALGVDEEQLTFVHPALDAMALGWEIAEPIAYMARLVRRPLPGQPQRHIYQPVGKDDEYFPIDVYDAAALAYGTQQAGSESWPSLQQALAVDGLGGVLEFPVQGNRAGTTAVVVQYDSDGIINSHYIYRQLDAVKHQYGCFLASYLAGEAPRVVAPGALDAPCQ